MHTHLILVSALACLATPAHARDDLLDAAPVFHIEPLTLSVMQDPPQPSPPVIRYELTAGTWLPRPGGNVRLGAVAPLIKLEDELDLDDLEVVPNFELRIRKNQVWDLHLGGFSFDSGGAGTIANATTYGSLSLAPGDPFRSSFDMDSGHIELSYAYLRPFKRTDPSSVELRFAPGVGARYLQSELVVTQIGTGTATGDGEWLIPYVSLLMELQWDDRDKDVPLLETLRIAVSGAFGAALGGDGGSMWQVRAGLSWRFNEHVEALFGYRLIELDVENEAFQLDAGLQGLFLGATIRF